MGFNENVVELSGLSRDELVGKTDLELNWGEWEADSFRDNDLEIINSGVSQTTEYEIPIKRADGHRIIVKTLKSPLRNKDNTIIGVLAVAIDITDQKLLEQELIAAKDNLDKLNQIKTDFIRNVEHDIRTPFAGINGLSMLLEEQETDSKKKTLINAISQSSKELLNYCNAILDFSRIESGSTPSSIQNFNLKDLINRLIRLEKAASLKNAINVSVKYPSTIPARFAGDSYKIERILVNLISNAIKFTHEGKVEITVKMARIMNERECIIGLKVQDTGIGMPEDKIPFIFDNFTRLTLSNQGKYKGAGLGLSIVKHLITDINGEIEVESQLGNGTTFNCLFPLKIPLLESPLKFKEI